MKSSILRAGVVTLACALGLSACGGGDGDLYLYGSISGVTKDGLVLKNGGSEVTVIAPYQSFQFDSRVATDDSFNIEVAKTPSNVDSCTVVNGKARANYYTIAQISVVCTIKTHKFVVAVNGLTGSGLVILNGQDNRTVAPGPNLKVEMNPVYEDGPYGVSILKQPTGQVCTVSGGDNGTGAGTMRDTDLNGKVVVNCA